MHHIFDVIAPGNRFLVTTIPFQKKIITILSFQQLKFRFKSIGESSKHNNIFLFSVLAMTFLYLGLSRAYYGTWTPACYNRYYITGLQRMDIILRAILTEDAYTNLS